MCPFTMIYFMIIAGIAIAAIVFVVKFRGAMDTRLTELGGQRTGMYNGTFNCQGQTATVYYHPGSRHRSSELRVSVEGNFSANIVVRRESAGDRLAKGVGLNREIQLNDPEFDETFYIECDDEQFVGGFFGRAEVKESLRGLLGTFSYFEVAGRRCSAVKRPCYGITGIGSDDLSLAAEQVVRVAKFVPVSMDGTASATPVTDEFRSSRNLFVGVGFVLFAAGMGLFFWGAAAYEPLAMGRLFVASLWFSLPLAALFIFYILHELSGHAASANAVLTAGLFVLIGLGFCGVGAGAVLNGLMDTSLRQAHQTMVISKRITHGKHSTYYKVTVGGWDQEAATYEFNVAWGTYDRLSAGAPCVVTTRKGSFGFEWVTEHSCEPGSRAAISSDSEEGF